MVLPLEELSASADSVQDILLQFYFSPEHPQDDPGKQSLT